MEYFLIVTNDGKDADGQVTAKVKRLLEGAGKTCVLCQKDENKQIIRDSVPERIDCALVIGGDGSLIEVARLLRGRGVPVLGINMGTLGYLTEVEVNHIEEAVARILRGEYGLEDRMMLEGVLKDGQKDVSLNDIVVSRKTEIRIIHFRIYVNGELLNSYEADGIIISTPTGSTAYNLSAGGPILEPTASMIVITPICPHALNTSSIVLSAEDEIVVEIGEGHHGAVEEAMVAFDGADTMPLVTGDTVTVRRAAASTRLMRLSQISFLEMLRRKMKGN
ncbi:MAG TPA: NAD(+)/NADH kinase [Candidatus Dorea gallistercoris]|uniref:NAD kinase n=1 Tax=Candidatus Dorea gallistercoris TaxID=2838542 RepID=A0A9D1RCY7_9FIRM|nr:NAD(+)/NADH kinase [Candidatus Dorea gallistercoris]